jgi:hypothetical protein
MKTKKWGHENLHKQIKRYFIQLIILFISVMILIEWVPET